MIRGWKLGHVGYVTGFYGSPKVGERRHSWDLLRRINPGMKHPWIGLGDFNEIMLP